MPVSTPPLVPISSTSRVVLGRFLRGSLGSGVAVLARGGSALLLNKLLAVYGGPGGLTLLAHFQNLLALCTALPNDGVHVGLVKYLAPLRPGSGRYRAWLGAGLLLNAGALLLGISLVVVLPGPLERVLGQGVGAAAVFGLGIALLVGHAFLLTVLVAAGQLRAYATLTVVLSALGVLAVAGVLAGGGTVPQALLAYLLAQGLTLLPTAWAAYRVGLLRAWWGRPSLAALRGVGQFVLMAVSLLLFGKAVDFALRDVLMARYGLAHTDLWQAVAKLSDNYTMVFSAVMGSVYYPRLAALVGQPATLRHYVRTVLLLLAPTLAVGLGTLYGLRDTLLPLLFSPQFVQARSLLAPQLLGDWAKFLTWALLFLLTARAQVGRYVAVQAGSAVLYAGLLAVLLPRYGLLGAPLAHAARFGVLLLGCLFWFRTSFRA